MIHMMWWTHVLCFFGWHRWMPTGQARADLGERISCLWCGRTIWRRGSWQHKFQEQAAREYEREHQEKSWL